MKQGIKLLIFALVTSTVGVANAQKLQPSQLDFVRNGSLLTVRGPSGKDIGTVDLDKPAVKGKIIAFTYSAKRKQEVENVASSISIFPNPATKEVKLQFKGSWKYPVDVRILDKGGNTLQATQLQSAEQPLNVESLAQGFYILKVQSGNASAVEKLVVQ
jgi:hypothetical protein